MGEGAAPGTDGTNSGYAGLTGAMAGKLVGGWRGAEVQAECQPRYTHEDYTGEDAAGVREEGVPVAGAARN
jgi:hypothetical protein